MNSQYCWSHWSRSLRHVLYSPTQILRSWVRIPLEAWISVYVHSVFMLSCVRSSFETGWSPVQRVLLNVYKSHNIIINSEREQARYSNSLSQKKNCQLWTMIVNGKKHRQSSDFITRLWVSEVQMCIHIIPSAYFSRIWTWNTCFIFLCNLFSKYISLRQIFSELR
jgi:hypothetical protein